VLLTISTTYTPASDLGYLLHKNPARLQTFELAFGQAYVFYPQATAELCTAALLLDIDPVGLVRGRGKNNEGALEQYVNDRPYVASSFLSVALAQVFREAMTGRSKERPELTQNAIPLKAELAVVPSRGGENLLRRLFEPLGYQLTVQNFKLDETLPEWGQSAYYTVTLEANCRLSDLLTHLYVLVPVLDEDKHYWVGNDEVEKLLRRGEGWLSQHPERELITSRYLKHRYLVRAALARLIETELETDKAAETHAQEEEAVERPLSLNEQRIDAVLAALKGSGAKRILDLGCGEGKVLQALLREKQFEEIIGMDTSYRVLEIAQERLHFDHMPSKQAERIKLIQGSLTYRDKRLAGYDAAAVVEVIEHLDPPRLVTFAQVLFEFARPKTIVITTPNIEFNSKFENLPAGKLRHKDHRFEWSRAEFQKWANNAAQQFGYKIRFLPIGPVDEIVGSPTQMAIFEL
jgi:3' terminal RNA ribose 2'-O-methyltransferase Hen1